MTTTKQCRDLAVEFYPELDDKEIKELLWGATCFPFGSPDHIKANLEELIKETDGTLEQALAFADKQLEEAMTKTKTKTESQKIDVAEVIKDNPGLGLGLGKNV